MKSKGKLSFQHLMAQNILYHSKREDWAIVRKYWTKPKSKPSKTIYKSQKSMSRVNGFRWFYPSTFATCNIHLWGWFHSLCLALFTTNITYLGHLQYLGFSLQLRLSFHSFTQWPLKACYALGVFMHEFFCHALPSLRDFIKLWRKSPWPFYSCI